MNKKDIVLSPPREGKKMWTARGLVGNASFEATWYDPVQALKMLLEVLEKNRTS